MHYENPADPLLLKSSRRLFYPKFCFSLKFSTPRGYIGYVAVSTRYNLQATGEILDFQLGTTETRTSELGDLSPIIFHKSFEVPYQVGVDEEQLISFEIFDGDHMMTTDGYLLSSKTLPLVHFAVPLIVIPIYRGVDLFGTLEVRTKFDVDCQKPSIDYNLESMAKTPNAFSSIDSLNSMLYYQKIVMGYFPYKAPTLAECRESHSSIPSQSSKFIEFGIHATGICPIDKQTMKKLDSGLFIKLCNLGEPGFEPAAVQALELDTSRDEEEALMTLTAEQKAEIRRREGEALAKFHEDVRKWARVQGQKDNLPVIWTSLTISASPYEILVDKVTLSQHDFPLNSKNWLSFQVYVTNWDEFAISVKPKLIAYMVVSARDFVAYAGSKSEEKGQQSSIVVHREFTEDKLFTFKRPTVKRGDVFFTEIIKKEKAKAESKNKLWSFSSKLGKGSNKDGAKFKVFSAAAEEEEEADVVTENESRLFKEKSPIDEDLAVVLQDEDVNSGTLRVMRLYELDTVADVGDGDPRYERLIREIYTNERTRWLSENRVYFNEQSNYQAHRLFVACSVINHMLHGHTIATSVVADMTYPCAQHVLNACRPDSIALLLSNEPEDGHDPDEAKKNRHYVEPSFDLSAVLNVVAIIYSSYALMTEARELRVFAGGGVTAPPDEFIVESKGDDGVHMHKISHWARGVKRTIGFPFVDELGLEEEIQKIKSKTSEKCRVARFLEDRGLGLNCAYTMKYCSKTELLHGAMEAAAMYKPLLSKDELENDSAHGKEEIKQRYLAAVSNPSICGQEFWARVPNDLEAKRIYNGDVDAVIRMLNEPHPTSYTGKHTHGIVSWVLGRSPNSSNLKFKHKLHHLLGLLAPRDMKLDKLGSNSTKKRGKDTASGNSEPQPTNSLIIILAAENQFYYDENSPRVLPIVADPFQSFWQHWFDYFKDHPYVQQQFAKDYPDMKEVDRKTFGPHYRRLKLPQVRIYHHATWAEVVASAFLEEDREAHELEAALNRAAAMTQGTDQSIATTAEGSGGANIATAKEVEGNRSQPLIKHIFNMLEAKFNRSDEIYNANDIRWQFNNIKKFQDMVVSSSTSSTVKKASGIGGPEDANSLDQSNLRLSYEANMEMKRRFDIQNHQLLCTVLLEFLNDTFNQQQTLIESPSDGEDHSHRIGAAVEGSGCIIN